MADNPNKKDFLNKRLGGMKTERSSFISHYQDISLFQQPRRGRFFLDDVNKGVRRHQNIINSKAGDAYKTARSGMFNGTHSPSRPWFSLETDDPALMEYAPVKNWLYDVEQMLYRIFRSSNFYRASPQLIGELILFGTGVMTQVEDFENVARFYTHTAGSYLVDQNDKCEIDVLAREVKWTVRQIVKRFGEANLSPAVKTLWDQGNYSAWVPIVHFIQPNEDYRHDRLESKYKKFSSCYYEANDTDKNRYLGESGFDDFPAFCPRWETTGEDIYGTDCPGMQALGDVMQLQVMEKREGQAIEKMVNPPLHGPGSLRNIPVSSLAGGLTLYDGAQDKNGLRPIYQVAPPLQELRVSKQATEDRIDRAYNVHLFRAISDIEGIQPRNELDLTKRDQERLLELGPVLESVNGEYLGKAVERTFNQADMVGILPPPPPELKGKPLKIVFISTLAMAQRSAGVQVIERVAGYVGSLIQGGMTDAGDKFDYDQSVDEYSRAIGAPPRIIVPDEEVARKRQERAQAQQEERAMMAAQGGAGVVKDLASAAPKQGA